MFSGIQEILVIVLLIVVVLLVPRMLQRGRRNAVDSTAAVGSRRPLPRSFRLAVVLSAVWLGVSVVYFQPWKSDPTLFFFIGISPVVLLWGIIWITR